MQRLQALQGTAPAPPPDGDNMDSRLAALKGPLLAGTATSSADMDSRLAALRGDLPAAANTPTAGYVRAAARRPTRTRPRPPPS